MSKKYILTDEVKYIEPRARYCETDENVERVLVHRIKSLIDIPSHHVKAGDLGGFVETEHNLSHDGDSWIADNAWVIEHARVHTDALVKDEALIMENAIVCGDAVVADYALVCDNAQVFGASRIFDNAKVCDNARVCDDASLFHECVVGDNALVSGRAVIQDRAHIYGDSIVSGRCDIGDDAKVYGSAKIYGMCTVYGDTRIFGNTVIRKSIDDGTHTRTIIRNKVKLGGNTIIDGNDITIEGDTELYGNVIIYDMARIRNNNDVIWINNIGLSNDTIVFYHVGFNNIGVVYNDEYIGDIKKFSKEMKRIHGNSDYYKIYKYAIKMAKLKMGKQFSLTKLFSK